jgi:hypothetical protein
MVQKGGDMGSLSIDQDKDPGVGSGDGLRERGLKVCNETGVGGALEEGQKNAAIREGAIVNQARNHTAEKWAGKLPRGYQDFFKLILMVFRNKNPQCPHVSRFEAIRMGKQRCCLKMTHVVGGDHFCNPLKKKVLVKNPESLARSISNRYKNCSTGFR